MYNFIIIGIIAVIVADEMIIAKIKRAGYKASVNVKAWKPV